MNDMDDKLIQMARECGFTGMHSNGKTYVVDSDGTDITPQLAAFRSAILADAAKDVEPVAWSVTCDGEHVNNIHTSEIEANRGKRNLDRDFPDHTREVVPLIPASTLAAAQALNAELRLVLAQRVPPGCVVVPVEPTEAMIDAADDAETRHVVAERRRGGTDTQLAWGVAYKAMIAAAPQAKEQGK